MGMLKCSVRRADNTLSTCYYVLTGRVILHFYLLVADNPCNGASARHRVGRGRYHFLHVSSAVPFAMHLDNGADETYGRFVSQNV
jgi:hypothetical protein